MQLITVPPALPVQAQFHSSPHDAGEYASAAQAKSLALVHIGPEYEGRHDALVEEARAMFAGTVFAPAAGEAWHG